MCSPRGIDVFAADGRFLRSVATRFAGTSALTIRWENAAEFLYGVQLRRSRAFKMSLQGNPVLILPFPSKAGVYDEGGYNYKPTAIAVAPDGSIFVADGYGKSFIHKYDARGVYLKSFGGRGREEGKLLDPHGLTIDERSGKPLLLVCDRNNRRLQHFDLQGNFVAVIAKDLRRPSAAAIYGEFVAVAELEGRVTLLDGDNREVAYLGENSEQLE
jgi:DNA-binding beta-propeller fold protein YncE